MKRVPFARSLRYVFGLAGVLALASPGEGQFEAAVDSAGLRTWGHADFSWRVRPLDGEETTLEPFRGRTLFINLWATWCTPCVRELGSIERLKDRLSDTDVVFLAIAPQAERTVERFVRRHGYDLPWHLELRRTPPAWGVRGLPTTWVVAPDGRIVLLRHGEAVWDTPEVEAFLRSVVGVDRRPGSEEG